MIRTNINLTEKIFKEIKKWALSEGISVSELIRRILHDALRKQ